MVEPRARRCRQHQGVFVVARAGVHVIRRVGALHVQPVGGQPSQAPRGVHRHHFGFQRVSLNWRVDAFVAPTVSVGVHGTVAATHPGRIQLGAIAVALSLWDGETPTVVNGTGAIAHPASIDHTDASIDIVTHPVLIVVGLAIPAAFACGVELVASAIAIALSDVHTQVAIGRPWQPLSFVVACRYVVAPLA